MPRNKIDPSVATMQPDIENTGEPPPYEPPPAARSVARRHLATTPTTPRETK